MSSVPVKIEKHHPKSVIPCVEVKFICDFVYLLETTTTHNPNCIRLVVLKCLVLDVIGAIYLYVIGAIDFVIGAICFWYVARYVMFLGHFS